MTAPRVVETGTHRVRATAESGSVPGVSEPAGIPNPKVAARGDEALRGVVGPAAPLGCGARRVPCAAAEGPTTAWRGGPYLTQMERQAVERVLRAAGYQQADPPDVWVRGPGRDALDLRAVFPTPFSALESPTGEPS